MSSSIWLDTFNLACYIVHFKVRISALLYSNLYGAVCRYSIGSKILICINEMSRSVFHFNKILDFYCRKHYLKQNATNETIMILHLLRKLFIMYGRILFYDVTSSTKNSTIM